MSTKNDGGPAFPALAQVGDFAAAVGGLTVRDWFAGMALQGMLSSDGGSEGEGAYYATWAYIYADAMLAEREK